MKKSYIEVITQTLVMMKPDAHEKLIEQLYENQPDSILWFIPVAGDGYPGNSLTSDFTVRYYNRAAAHIYAITPSELKDKSLLLSTLMDEVPRKQFFEQCHQVWKTGNQAEYTYYSQVHDRYFNVQLSKVLDGILSITRDRTQAIKNELENESLLKEQKNLLSNILDASLGVVCTCEAVRNEAGAIVDLRFIMANQMFRKLSPEANQDVIGKNMLELFPAIKNTIAFQKHCEVIETGAPTRFETHYARNGLDAWYEVSSAKIGTDKVVISFADITEQKKIALEITEQKTLLDKILKHSANGISVTKVIRNEEGGLIDGQTILANDAAIKLTGIPREIYLSKRALELDPNIAETPYFQMLIKTLVTGDPQLAQYYVDSAKRWLEITVSKLDNDHLITIFTDVTPFKEAQIRQQQLLEELKRSNQNLEEFVYAASHDLKEPIRKIHFFTEQLKERLKGQGDQDHNTRLLQRVENSAKRMGVLVDDLLELSHVSKGKEQLEEINLNQKLQVVLEELELRIQEKRAHIEIGLLPSIRGHRRQMQQLFQNLIGNALKYSKPDTTPHIVIRSQIVKGNQIGVELFTLVPDWLYHLIEVQDNGIGFEQKDAERIFNVFTRLHGNAEYSGNGVGLSIARKVVENHGGYLWAESEPGKGSTFKVLIPAGGDK